MVNSPIPVELGGECRKAAKVLNSFIKPNALSGLDSVIPADVLRKAKGLAILTVMKAGFIWSGRVGSGIVVARLADGSWSAPSAIATAGMGFGGQIGAEVTDFVIILNTLDAVKAFSYGGNVTLGGNLSVAAGPVGRNAEAAATMGNFAAIFSYSKTKGLFAGVSLEGSAIIERKDANKEFYHRKISAKEILAGQVQRPAAAADLYRALDLRTGAQSGLGSGDNITISPQGPAQTLFHNTTAASPATDLPSYAAAAAASSSSSSGPTIMATPMTAGKTTRPVPGPPPAIPPRALTAVALFDFVAQRPDDLSFSKGDVVVITRRTDSTNDWWTGRANGKMGNFPANYVKLQ